MGPASNALFSGLTPCGESIRNLAPFLDPAATEHLMHIQSLFQRTLGPRPIAILFTITVALAVAVLAPFSSATASELRRTAIVRAVERVRPSVVNIHGHKSVATIAKSISSPFGDNAQEVNGMGTGVVIDPRGYIITNYHVVQGVARIQVTLADRRTYVARLVAHDSETDLAVIRIPESANLPVVTIGTSSDLMPGEPVVAVGNAFGYEHTVTRGIISALHRNVPVSDTQKYFDLIQTDASINPGNSGGPLLNIDGEMIGINVAVRIGAQGIGFAIPVDKAMEVAAKLLSAERNGESWHGVIGKSTISAHSKQYFVRDVQEGSPAAKAGLKAGDRITSVEGMNIERALDFERAFLQRKVGEEVRLEVERDLKTIAISLVLDAAPDRRPSIADRAWQQLGLQLDPIASSQFQQVSSRYRGGLKIEAVRPGGGAARLGIRRGDVLVGMHVWETISLDNVAYVLDRPDLEKLQPIKFYLLRDGETLYTHLAVTPRQKR